MVPHLDGILIQQQIQLRKILSKMEDTAKVVWLILHQMIKQFAPVSKI